MNSQEEQQKYITESHLGMFIEQMNEQFERVLEAVDSQTSRIPKMAERIEMLERDMQFVTLSTSYLPGDLDLLKVRTEKIQTALDSIQSDMKISRSHERRISKLESARS